MLSQQGQPEEFPLMCLEMWTGKSRSDSGVQHFAVKRGRARFEVYNYLAFSTAKNCSLVVDGELQHVSDQHSAKATACCFEVKPFVTYHKTIAARRWRAAT